MTVAPGQLGSFVIDQVWINSRPQEMMSPRLGNSAGALRITDVL